MEEELQKIQDKSWDTWLRPKHNFVRLTNLFVVHHAGHGFQGRCAWRGETPLVFFLLHHSLKNNAMKQLQLNTIPEINRFRLRDLVYYVNEPLLLAPAILLRRLIWDPLRAFRTCQSYTSSGSLGSHTSPHCWGRASFGWSEQSCSRGCPGWYQTWRRKLESFSCWIINPVMLLLNPENVVQGKNKLQWPLWVWNFFCRSKVSTVKTFRTPKYISAPKL